MTGKGTGAFTAFIISLLLAACATAGKAETRTEIIAFAPAVPEQTKVGRCDGPSQIVGRADARQCMVGHHIFDPCVKSADKLVCGATPWSSDKSFVIDVGTPPIESPHADPGGVVAMELADGARCAAVGGDTIEFDGKAVNYRCDAGEATERVVLGHPVKGKVWMADYAQLGHNANGYFVHERKTIAVPRVWR